MSDKDKDKEEDERDVGECEHQDPPEQPGAGLAAVQAFRISASSLLWTCPCLFSRLRALSPPGNLLPHDVQDGGAHEAVLYGAREQQGGDALCNMHWCKEVEDDF